VNFNHVRDIDTGAVIARLKVLIRDPMTPDETFLYAVEVLTRMGWQP